jgi:hypothetical protein
MTNETISSAAKWVLTQPSTAMSIDAKCLIGEQFTDEAGWQQIVSDKLALLRALRQPDGGYESKYGGGRAGVLATADAISWLTRYGTDADAAAIEAAIRWLAHRQLADGSWLEEAQVPWGRHWYRAPSSHLWITAAVLRSLQDAVPTADIAGQGWRFLDKALRQLTSLSLARVSTDVLDGFGFERFSLVVAVDAYLAAGREYTAAAETITVLRPGQKNGCWQGSIDVTQATAYGLLLLTGDPHLPEIQAARSFLIGCARPDGGWAHSGTTSVDWTLTAYTVRLISRLKSSLRPVAHSSRKA